MDVKRVPISFSFAMNAHNLPVHIENGIAIFSVHIIFVHINDAMKRWYSGQHTLANENTNTYTTWTNEQCLCEISIFSVRIFVKTLENGEHNRQISKLLKNRFSQTYGIQRCIRKWWWEMAYYAKSTRMFFTFLWHRKWCSF